MEQNRTLARTLARELTNDELLAVAGGGPLSPEKTSTATCCASGEDDCGTD